MSGPLHLAHVLPPNVEDGRAAIVAWLARRQLHHLRPLCLTQAATFIDPKEVAEADQHTCLHGVLSIAIVDGLEYGHLVAAFLPVSKTRHEENVSALLRKHGIPTFIGDLGNPALIEDFLDHCNLNYQYSSDFRKVINISEAKLIRAVKFALGIWVHEKAFDRFSSETRRSFEKYLERNQRRFRVYEEIAVGAIVKSPRGNYLGPFSAYRVDILIAAPPPLSTPLFVVEFDGPQHSKPEKALKDNKRDQFLLENAIPVLRISHRNANSGLHTYGSTTITGSYFFNLISRISALVEKERVKNVLEMRKLEERRLRSAKRLLSEYRKEHSTLSIPEEEISDVLFAKREDLDWEYDLIRGEMLNSFLVDDLLESFEWKNEQNPLNYSWLSNCLDSEGPLKVRVEGEIKKGLTIKIEGTFRNGITAPVFGPFYAELKAPDIFSDKLESLAKEAAIVTALDWMDLKCELSLRGDD